MQDLQWELRAYELSLPREKRKRLGQFFTEPAVARLLAALCIRGPVNRVLDAMAGHGSLLDAAAQRLAMTGGSAELFGVEIDPATARLCETRIETCVREFRQQGVRIACSSAFSETVWDDLATGGGFDVVIGNPPYVRYQSTTRRRDEVRNQLRRIAERRAPEAERDLWRILIDGYSGLADLSVPSWILCSVLCRPGGMLGLVVPRTWMNRAYARLMQYIQLRFFRPLFIIEEQGVGWFEDALVPTTLVVSRRLSPESAMIPLNRRENSGESTVRVGIPAVAGVGGESLVSKVFPCQDPEGAFAAWATTNPTAADPLKVWCVSLPEERSRLLAAVHSEAWARSAECGFRVAVSAAPADTRSLIPSAVAQSISLPPRPRVVSFTAIGIRVGQGLRTGCNAFFYVDEVLPSAQGESATVRTSELFHRRRLVFPRAILRPALRRQSELEGFVVHPGKLCGRVLDLRKWLTSEERGTLQNQLFASAPTHQMTESLAEYVRAAATTSIRSNGQAVLIPYLSAVAPNERASARGAPRRWYMLPDFAPRHLPLVFVPRVNDGSPWFVRNAPDPVIVDANFSTVYDRGSVPTSAALLAVLNSIWVRACCESIGSPMGAGALKLEATHLRELPIPVLSPEGWEHLDKLGQALASAPASECTPILRRIDETVVAAVYGVDVNATEVASACDALATLLKSLRHQRQRKGGACG